MSALTAPSFHIAPSSDHRATALAIAYNLFHHNKNSMTPGMSLEQTAAFIGALAKEIMNKANVATT